MAEDETENLLWRWHATEMEKRLRKIDRIVWTQTGKGTSAYTHFQRDFDQIRELTAPWHESKTDG